MAAIQQAVVPVPLGIVKPTPSRAVLMRGRWFAGE
jgi:hypothetical protein